MRSTHNIASFRDHLRQRMPELSAQYGVRALGIFGSYVHGRQHPGSDLDILVEFDETPGLLSFIELEQNLTDSLGVTVDLVMKQALKPSIGAQVLKDVIPV